MQITDNAPSAVHLRELRSGMCKVTERTWKTMLGLPIRRCATASAGAGSGVVSWVRISGQWEGAVKLLCSLDLAREAAGAIFGVRPDEANSDHVHDCMSEMANIIGGNIKSLLPGFCRLSLPLISDAEGESPDLRELVAECAFESDAGYLCVQLFGKEAEGEDADAARCSSPAAGLARRE